MLSFSQSKVCISRTRIKCVSAFTPNYTAVNCAVNTVYLCIFCNHPQYCVFANNFDVKG